MSSFQKGCCISSSLQKGSSILLLSQEGSIILLRRVLWFVNLEEFYSVSGARVEGLWLEISTSRFRR